MTSKWRVGAAVFVIWTVVIGSSYAQSNTSNHQRIDISNIVDAGKPYPQSHSLMVRGCSKPIRGGILGIESEVLKFGGKIRDIQEFYLNAPEAPGDLTERIKKRNKAVFDEFEKLRAQRRKLLDAFRCDFYRKQTCTAASGDTRTCPRSFAPPAGKLFVVESITVQGTGLVSEVKTSDSSISFLMRTSGGKNTLHIRSRLRATPKSIAQLVEDELQSVRRALAAYHLPDDKLYVP